MERTPSFSKRKQSFLDGIFDSFAPPPRPPFLATKQEDHYFSLFKELPETAKLISPKEETNTACLKMILGPSQDSSKNTSSKQDTSTNDDKKKDLRASMVELNSTLSGSLSLSSAMKAASLLKRIYATDFPISQKLELANTYLSSDVQNKLARAFRYFKNGGGKSRGGGGGKSAQNKAVAPSGSKSETTSSQTANRAVMTGLKTQFLFAGTLWEDRNQPQQTGQSRSA